ncbi:MAG: glycine cleavage system aminomethyltransferase GcvT [Actinomycetota bacterium]|nr:glycine cleavage system aminomethyltransferase GcvT [Actinomycetota bacterium]MDH5223650.1 glycine cleavage system aminomethyltransferase GcvT [Actinomycetota bacterium]MDH5312396.1 glycine cleavage system aminomethyltransferase GcvT [Actinomycetota bacterium]
MDEPAELKHTPLEIEHKALGAKLGPFAGWLMPIEYAGALSEHEAVRERVGLFDLTHLGKVDVAGPGAMGMLQQVVTNDVEKAAVGEALYSLVLNEGGGVIEDLITYRLDEERFFVVPNAANAQRVLQILEETPADDRVHLMYHQDWCFLAVQGPESVHVVQDLFPGTADLAFMQCVESEYKRRPVIVTRSGYTGEVGFELFTFQDIAHDLWRALRQAMEPYGGAACGLAARDVLRLEMGYPLYGQDLFESSTALEAGLSWAVSFDKGEFRGRASLLRQREEGLPSQLVGLRMHERRHIPRAHYPVFIDDQLIGEVTSGTFSPLLQTGIGLAYIWPADVAAVGDTVEVDIRGRRGAAEVVRPPFVARSPR